MAAANALADSLGRATGKHQCVNVDGALAVSLLTVGLPPEYGDCLFGIARLAGLSAHAIEERTRQRPMRVIEPGALVYDGPATHVD
jgi:citrate synthase